jgi:hypothetical protein
MRLPTFTSPRRIPPNMAATRPTPPSRLVSCAASWCAGPTARGRGALHGPRKQSIRWPAWRPSGDLRVWPAQSVAVLVRPADRRPVDRGCGPAHQWRRSTLSRRAAPRRAAGASSVRKRRRAVRALARQRRLPPGNRGLTALTSPAAAVHRAVPIGLFAWETGMPRDGVLACPAAPDGPCRGPYHAHAQRKAGRVSAARH